MKFIVYLSDLHVLHENPFFYELVLPQTAAND